MTLDQLEQYSKLLHDWINYNTLKHKKVKMNITQHEDEIRTKQHLKFVVNESIRVQQLIVELSFKTVFHAKSCNTCHFYEPGINN